MKRLDWNYLKNYYSKNNSSTTKQGRVFKVGRVTDTAIYVTLSSGRTEYISRELLESAVELINQGKKIKGPVDYKKLVYDQRPAYAYAILRDMGFVE